MDSERSGLQKVRVDGEPAYVLTQLVGSVAVGDEVIVNVTAVELGLGTGGWHFVHWNLARREWSRPGPGHIMKLRYTSLQTDTGAAEEAEGSPRCDGVPVVVCALHSQLPVVCAAVAKEVQARVSYVMTDDAALPAALSDSVWDLRSRGLISEVITAGHAFGGDREAVNVVSALALAGASADVVVVAPGPGVVGTGSRLGHSGVSVAQTVDGAAALGARPIVAVRYSQADDRGRHRGVSHHTATALELAWAMALVPYPTGQDEPKVPSRHRAMPVEVGDVNGLLATHGLAPTSMGRGVKDDPAFFEWSAAAGLLAAQVLRNPGYPAQP